MNPYYQDDWVAIYHGDSRSLLPIKADMVLTDIPYNASRKSGGLRNLEYGDWDHGFEHDWVVGSFTDVPVVYIWCGNEQLSGLLVDLAAQGRSTRALVWSKPSANPMNGERLWVQSSELCAFGRMPKATHNLHCAKSVIDMPYPPARQHPTQKPLGLFRLLVSASSNQGDIVLDPFAGSGTTGRAAKDLGRRAVLIEQEEKYCEIAAKRMAQEVLDL